METVFVGIGSNLERARSVRHGVVELRVRYGDVRCSTVYESPAVGYADAAPFYNLVVAFESAETPEALVASLRGIESSCGRENRAALERTLDLDLLLVGQMVSSAARLPRDDIDRFGFVLRPLSELAGARRHPVSGETYADLWTRFDASGEPMIAVSLDLDHPTSGDPVSDGPGIDGPGIDGPGIDGPGIEGPGPDGPGPDLAAGAAGREVVA